ncbi:MAG: LysM peptidoglycan-binding domain-containing protein [Spirochaetaceae bacterium]|nr:LysM peptidoglycan-binding domain-containing protein [Spirochaetaceae bacterium]
MTIAATGGGMRTLVAIAVLITIGIVPLAAQECRSDWQACDQARVEHYIKQFTKRTWRGWLHGVWERSWIYADHIGAALERRGLPQELRLLPVIESGYLPEAVSPSGAVGIWQITRLGASGYPLRMDGGLDERRDFWKATEVALDTLATNRERFGDWLLAIAAYNAGPGGVQRAIDRAGTRDFWELRRSGALPQQTAEFVPRFLAAVRVFSEPERYGLAELEPITWVRVGAGGRADLRKVAAHTGMDLELLRTANAELGSVFTPNDARVAPAVIASGDTRAADLNGYWLKVPAEHAERVRALLEERTQLFDFTEHVIRAGETFWAIAKRYGSSVDLIVGETPGLHPQRLRPGQTAVVPLLGAAPVATTPVVGTSVEHRVRPGETFWDLALRYGSSVERILRGNPGVNPRRLRPGLTVIVPLPGSVPDVESPGAAPPWLVQAGSGAVHVVEHGESLWGIARTHGVTVEALAASNGRSPDDVIKPGETLIVQAGGTLSSA